MQFVLRVASQFDDKCAQGGGINLSHPVRVCSVVVERVTGTPIYVLIIDKNYDAFCHSYTQYKSKRPPVQPANRLEGGEVWI